MTIGAQISLYPLGQSDLGPAIRAVLAALDEHGLLYEVGAMNTTLWGEEAVVWAALRDAFARAAAHGGAVMQITLSNACPLPPEGARHD
jgi:uncharacterized protein YqgV (UPF0045/DUF77 family)